jgi:hypothetical protein
MTVEVRFFYPWFEYCKLMIQSREDHPYGCNFTLFSGWYNKLGSKADDYYTNQDFKAFDSIVPPFVIREAFDIIVEGIDFGTGEVKRKLCNVRKMLRCFLRLRLKSLFIKENIHISFKAIQSVTKVAMMIKKRILGGVKPGRGYGQLP